MSLVIPFHKPYISGNELSYISECIDSGKLSGDGAFTKKCQRYFEQSYGFKKCLLTTSCTDALEMSAILLNIKAGDEVIAPSYTFVSSVNVFALHGARIVFADSCTNSPNIDTDHIEELITPKTKIIIVVHYAGIACDMGKVMELAKKYGLFVIEDAAQAVDSYYNAIPLGSIGHTGAFSFHGTKNITCGEGGMIVVNDEAYFGRAEIIREKGTNRSAFLRGEINKYEWIDVGSSFLPSDITAAFLYAQLRHLKTIQQQRMELWELYRQNLIPLQQEGYLDLPFVPSYAVHNASTFYIICRTLNERMDLSRFLKTNGIDTAFHFLPLNKSSYYTSIDKSGRVYRNAERYADCLLRLPLYPELTADNINYITESLGDFYKSIRK